MRITIVGGGNIGTQFAVHCAYKNHEVTVFTSEPHVFGRHLSIVDETGAVTCEGDIALATADPEEAFHHAELILVTYPPAQMSAAARAILAHGTAGVTIGVAPGNGGAECAFRDCIRRGDRFFGLERVPAIARLVRKGHSVRSVGYRKELHVAALPAAGAAEFCSLVGGLFDMPCVPIPNYLNLTMTPSNPLLHTTRLRTVFRDYRDGVVYDRVPRFYEDWDDAASTLLLACDDELQDICRALPEFPLQYVVSLRDYYESPTPEAMTKKIAGIPAFRGLMTPMVRVPGGFIPDLHSRYFTSDFSYGLTIIKQIAEFAGVPTPSIDATMAWYADLALEHDRFRFSDWGIADDAAFREFYLQ